MARQLRRLDAAHASLGASRERFALAVAGSDDGIWDWNRHSDTIFASARARELFGLPPGPEKTPREQWLAQIRVHPDDVAPRLAAIEAHIAGKTPQYEFEYRVRHPDDSWRWVRVRGLCLRDANGDPLRMAGSVSDSDARRRAEEERRLSEQALRLSEERYAIAMTASDEAHWVWNVKTDELYSSPQLHRLTGVVGAEAPATRSEWRARVPMHPDDREGTQRAVDDHLAGLTPRLLVEYRIIDPATGEVRWIGTRGQCFRDSEGRPERVAGSTVDITERKRAEEALRESEERFARAVAGTNDGIVDWDITNDRFFASKRALLIAGVDPAVVVRTHDEWIALLDIHPDDKATLKQTFRHQAQEGDDVQEADCRVRQRDGSYRWVRFRGRHLHDAERGATRWSGSISDIDAHKRAEQALRESEQRYELAVAGSNEGMWDWDMRSETFFFSARAQELLGLDPGEPMRPCQEWWSIFRYHPDDEQRVHEALKAYLDGAGAHWEVEYRIHHRRSDSWRWFRERGVALRDEQGQPYRMAGSIEDITARKSAEAERDRLESQLRQSQKLEAMGTLAGGIAHDFNNILAAILGYGEMVQHDCAEGTAQRRHIDAAMSAALRAKSLVERILAFSRSGTGERVPVNVQSVVDEALIAIAASLPAGVRLERDLTAGDAAVHGDPTQIHQVVMNLCANAVQAMRSHGTLAVSLQATHRGRRCVHVDGAARGPAPTSGWPCATPAPASRPRCSSASSIRSSPPRESASAPGSACRWCTASWPTWAAASTSTAASAPAAPSPSICRGRAAHRRLRALSEPVAGGSGQTILLVDDEEALVRLGEEMMAELGYEAVGFVSSASALEIFRETPNRFDAVLSDEAMPEMTGCELAREIRRIRPDIPIVLMSGYVTPALVDRAHDLGIVDVLAKPLAERDMARSMADALNA